MERVGRAVFLRDITVMPSGQLAPKGQGLGAFDPATQTLYFPGSAGDLVDNRVFSVNLRTSGSPTVNTGAPKLDVNGMEWSAAAGGGKGAPLVLGTTINGSDLSATALYEVVPQAPPIATPWKKLHDYGASVDTMGNTAISADGRYVSPNLSQIEKKKKKESTKCVQFSPAVPRTASRCDGAGGGHIACQHGRRDNRGGGGVGTAGRPEAKHRRPRLVLIADGVQATSEY